MLETAGFTELAELEEAHQLAQSFLFSEYQGMVENLADKANQNIYGTVNLTLLNYSIITPTL